MTAEWQARTVQGNPIKVFIAGLLALVAADGFHRAGRGGHGRSLQNQRAGRNGRQQNRGGRSRFQAGRRGRQEEVAAGYDAPAGDAYGAPADDAYGAPADDAYGAPAEGSADYEDYGSGADDSYGAPAGADDAYGAPAGADDAYGAPAAADDAYGAPADDAYGAPAEGSGEDYGDYPDYGADVPLDAYAATEAAPTYEDARRGRARGGFGKAPARQNTRGGRAKTFGSANRKPAPARKAPRAGRAQKASRPASRPAPRRQPQEQRRGRGLIPIPVPHRGPRRNAIAFRHNARQG